MKRTLFCLMAATALVVSCAPKLKVAALQPDPVQVPPKLDSPEMIAPTADADLAAGKTLYENKCAMCHRLYEPREFTPEAWKPILKSMAIKANIDDAQRDQVYRYIVSGFQ